MASQESNTPEPNRRIPTPQQRNRLKEIFKAAAKQASLQRLDDATDLYADCVRGDPGNFEYLYGLISMLHKRYGSANKLGPIVRLKVRGKRAALKKSVATCKWDDALQQGIEVLLLNPWDVPTLTQMATACSGILQEEGLAAAASYGDCELFYLKCAFDTFPRGSPNLDVCNQMAEALKKRERH